MAPQTAKSTFRITQPNLKLADEIGERLGGLNRTEVVNLGLAALADRLGLTQQDAALAADSLAARYGDDAVLVVRVGQWDDDGETVDATVSVTVNGEDLDDWTALFVGTTKVKARPERPGHTATIVHVVHDPTGANFVLGGMAVREGAQVSVRVRDLHQHVVALPSEGEMDAGELRRHVRNMMRLRRMLREAGHPDFVDPEENEPEGPPLDD